MCTLFTHTNTCMPRFNPSGFFGPSKCLIPTPGLTTEYPICAVSQCVCVCVYTHIHPQTLPPALKIEKTQTTPLSLLYVKNNPPRQATSALIDQLNPPTLVPQFAHMYMSAYAHPVASVYANVYAAAHNTCLT